MEPGYYRTYTKQRNQYNISRKMEDNKMIDKEQVCNLIHRLESLRIDVEVETAYCDPTGVLTQVYERANDMLDDCISEVKEFYKDILQTERDELINNMMVVKEECKI